MIVWGRIPAKIKHISLNPIGAFELLCSGDSQLFCGMILYIPGYKNIKILGRFNMISFMFWGKLVCLLR
jgi:hypothetical protein